VFANPRNTQLKPEVV